MIFNEPQVEPYVPEKGIAGMYKAIEYAARVCTATKHLMSEDSKKFVEGLIQKKHFRPLEFGTVYLKLPIYGNVKEQVIVEYLRKNIFSRAYQINGNWYITTNYRVLYEQDLCDIIDKYWSDDEQLNIQRYYYEWFVSRATADSFRTYVMLSTLMQSTRYCNFSLDKYGNQIKISRPEWLNTKYTSKCVYEYEKGTGLVGKHIEGETYSTINLEPESKEYDYIESLAFAEQKYLRLTNKERDGHLTAELARGVLPLDLYTDCIQCGFGNNWDNFFDQRVGGTTGKPQPDAKHIGEKALLLHHKNKQQHMEYLNSPVCGLNHHFR